MKHSYLLSLLTILLLILKSKTFQFASLIVQAQNKTINTVTRYKFTYDRTQNDNVQPTNYASILITTTDTITVTFPTIYTLTSVTCTISINGATAIVPTSCTVSTGRVIVSGFITVNSVVAGVVLWVNGVVNPVPALVTDYFYGTIGADTSGTGYFASTVILQPAAFLSCYVTFSPNIVNSTADMLITVTPRNVIGAAGSIQVQLPVSRRWTNDISLTNYIPISTSMVCSNKSANLRSTFQCIGDSSSIVTASNLLLTDTSSSFSFSINSLLSPPTQQPTDAITITSYISGSKIDTCTTYVTNLSPKTMTSLVLTTSTQTAMQINKQYILRFTFTLPDTLALNDTLVVTFPTGTVLALNTGTVSSNFSVLPSSTTYDSNTLSLSIGLSNQNRSLAAGSVLFLNVGAYTAPPSIQPTSDFTMTFFRGGFRKIQGKATLTATQSTLSGSCSTTTATVNTLTTYTFSLTTLDPISSSGRIKIIFPTSTTFTTTNPSCATISSSLTNSNLALSPVCTFNTIENSITFSNLNSSSSVIQAQSFSIAVNGVRNQGWAGVTDGFKVYTYYRGSQVALVASGIVTGVTVVAAELDTTRVSVAAGSHNVNDQSVTYSITSTILHPIPAGGYFLFLVPSNIILTPSSVAGQCSININSTSFVQTSCTASTTASGYSINFTNPFTVDMTVGSTFIGRVSSVFTNPYSTRPTNTFGLITYHSNGNMIAGINGSLFVQMDTPDSFQITTVSRLSQTNYDLTTYTFTFKQKSPIQPLSFAFITFPSSITLPTTTSCLLTSPSSTALGCQFVGSILKVILPNTAYASSTNFIFTVSNIRNPASFAPAGTFTFKTSTPQQTYTYSNTILNPALVTSIATAFQDISYAFMPATYATPVSLTINFDPSQSGVIPTTLRLTLANSFTINTLTCNSFVNFVGTCNVVALNTIDVTGGFSTASMSFSVTGMTSPITPISDFSTLISLDSGGYRLDESTNKIKFGISCTMPCMTCDPVGPTVCTSCYTNILITAFIYYDQTLKGCYQDCVEGKYEFTNSSSNLCLTCDANCLACNLSPTFCTKCNSATSFKYLLINTTAGTQKCLSSCPSTYYPQTSLSPTTCKPCVSPCKECTTSLLCTSCLSGFFYYQQQCLTSCPIGTAIANSVTNNCDFCDPNCLTCSGTITTCTSCNQSLLLYLNICRTSCPSPLVPKNGTCGTCDSTCKTCIDNPFKCTSCDTTTTLAYLYNNLCLSDCPETYYKNIGAGACTLCSSVINLNCNNCSTASTCKSCNLGYVLHLQNCLNYVPSGFVNISGVAVACTGDCLTCSVIKENCTSCINLNFFNYQCLTNCPSGYTAVSKICQACQSPCRTCITTIDTCTSCITTLSPSVFLTNSQCLQNCPNGMYAALTNFTCVACVSPCQYCTSVTVCLTCLNGFFLFNNSCGTVCPVGYAGINRLCLVCLGNCATCQGTVNTCLTCKPDTYLLAVNSSCVTSCGTGLFIDYLTRTCVTCSAPCKTCTNTSDTCLSCTTGILYNSQCLSQCPQKYFAQSNQCQLCPTNCSSCISLVNCTGCTQDFVLYTGFCITSCPSTHAVIINSVCTQCSTVNCHKCTSADFCTDCSSGFSLYNGACLGVCPSGFQTNGTHCADTNVQVLTASAAFPIPFSIATVVIIIASLMSKLQFQHTFMAGAIYSLVSIIEWAALAYFLYLYFIQFFVSTPLPFLVGAAALAYLYLLNFLAVILQNYTMCTDKHFKSWYNQRSHKITAITTNILSTLTCHKFRNILFSKLFTFDIFTAQLQSNSKFKVFNVFSFLSLLHSGAAIFATAVAISNVQAFSQLFYACVDVMVATGINVVLAFFNVLKPADFFYERTADGFQLKKKITGDQDFYHSKISPEGKAIEDEEGFATNIYRVQAGTGFTTNQLLKIRDGSDLGDKDYSFGSLMEKNVQEISIQAVEQLPQKQGEFNEGNNDESFSVVFGNSAGRSGILPKYSKYSSTEIQSSPMLAKGKQQRLYNADIIKQEDSSQRTIFYNQKSKNTPYQSLKSENEITSKNSKIIQKDRKKVFDSSIEQSKSEASKNILYKPKLSKNVQEQTIQGSELKDAAVGKYQPIQCREDQPVKTKIKVDEAIQRGQIGNEHYQVQNSEYKQKQTGNVIFEEQEEYHDEGKQKQTLKKVSKGLAESKKQEIVLPKQEIKQYEKQLQDQIKAKNQELLRMKKKIEDKQKFNSAIKNAENVVQAGRLYKKSSNSPEKQRSKSKPKPKRQSPQKIVEEIDVIDSSGDKKVIKVQFNDDISKQTDQDYLEALEDPPKELIYQESDNEKPQQDEFVQIISKGKAKQQTNNIILAPEKAQQGPKQSETDMTSGNDTSTKFQSSTLNAGNKRGGQTDGTLLNVDQIDKSIDQDSEGIHEKPKQSSLIKDVHTDLQDVPRKQTRAKLNVPHKKGGKNLMKIQSKDGKLNSDQEKVLSPNKVQDGELPKRHNNTGRTNPLKVINRFEFEKEDKNISESGEQQGIFSRTYRNRLTAPFETDKEETQFKTSGTHSPRKIMAARAHNTIPARTSFNEEFDDRPQRHSPSKNSVILNMQYKQSPLKSQKYDMEFGPPDREDEPDIEFNERQERAETAGLDRQGDDELRRYYQQTGARKSRQKSKKRAPQSQVEAEKIYMQRQDLPKKWK